MHIFNEITVIYNTDIFFFNKREKPVFNTVNAQIKFNFILQHIKFYLLLFIVL